MPTAYDKDNIMPAAIDRLIDVVIDRIITFSDYFIVKRRVTLSEMSTFFFSLAWALWFLFVGVYVGEMALSRQVWTGLFMLATLVHFISFFFEDIIGRAFIMAGYAFMWTFLTILSWRTGAVAPAVPTLGVMAVMAVMIAVRLFRERGNRKAGTHVSLG